MYPRSQPKWSIYRFNSKESFTLVELLIVMAIVAVLMGIAIYGITIVQRNTRDTARRSKLNEINIYYTELASRGNTGLSCMPGGGNCGGLGAYNHYSKPTNSETLIYFPPAFGFTINIPDFLHREYDVTNSPSIATTSVSTNYCSSGDQSQVLYVIGVQLESGSWYIKTNSGYNYVANESINGLSCVEVRM